jgi:hypothetical protein
MRAGPGEQIVPRLQTDAQPESCDQATAQIGALPVPNPVGSTNPQVRDIEQRRR